LKREFKNSLIRHLDFLEAELKDYAQFKEITKQQYLRDRDKRRNVERWIENVINSTVDISKVILTFEGMSMPDTYRGIVSAISSIDGLEKIEAEKVSRWVRFRNIIAHEYLDIKWSSIKKFIDETETLYKTFLRITKLYLKNKIESEEQENQQEENRGQ